MRTKAIGPSLIVTLLVASTTAAAKDPLPSWNDGPAKRSVVAFVERVTKRVLAFEK